MKKFWKALALVGCALLLVVASVAGTYAILTSKTATVSNTFTAGNVSISLKETKVDEYGKPVSPAATIVAGLDGITDGNKYKLIPNHTYKKDPTIVVAEGSEDCYLFVKVENGISEIEAAGDTTIAKQLEANGWVALDGVTNVYYKAAKAAAGDEVAIFTSFTIKQDAVVSSYTSANINITAYAAQADGFDISTNTFAVNAKNAWSAANFS